MKINTTIAQVHKALAWAMLLGTPQRKKKQNKNKRSIRIPKTELFNRIARGEYIMSLEENIWNLVIDGI